jgi:glycosyltransferase involved in cell wall biosynthesis
MTVKALKRVLIVAYVFPPVGGAGVQRVTKFVKYLPEFAWQVTVLTAANPSVPLQDESLLADVPPQTKIVRARTLEPGYALKRSFLAGNTGASAGGASLKTSLGALSAVQEYAARLLRKAVNLVLQPDPQVLWNHQAIKSGLRILSQSTHDAIFVTAPPFSSLLVGAALSRRTGLPLVLDFRDEWGISNAYWENRWQSAFTRWPQGRMQRKVVRSASALVATTRHSAEALRAVATEAGVRLLVTHIYNGFDADDFSHGKSPLLDAVADTGTARETYKLSYVGTLWNMQSAEPLVRAVQLLSQQSTELAARLELHFAGRRTVPQDELLNQLDGLPCRVTRQPYVDHDEAVKVMQSSDGLCLLLTDLPGAERVVPGKLFEYLAVHKPILAVIPLGEAADLLRDFPLGYVHPPRDIAGLARRLGDDIERKRLGVAPPVCLHDTNQFERRQLTAQLAELFDAVTERWTDRHAP